METAKLTYTVLQMDSLELKGKKFLEWLRKANLDSSTTETPETLVEKYFQEIQAQIDVHYRKQGFEPKPINPKPSLLAYLKSSAASWLVGLGQPYELNAYSNLIGNCLDAEWEEFKKKVQEENDNC